MIDGIAIKGKWIIVPFILQNQILEYLYSNYLGIEKARLLERESLHWVNINTDIKDAVNPWTTYLKYKQTQPQESVLPPEIPYRP